MRAAGGVCIADEVQTGFGRIGTHFWAFETQGVVPDIVVLGKPIGNGHPLGGGGDDAGDRRRRSTTAWSTSAPSAATRSRARSALAVLDVHRARSDCRRMRCASARSCSTGLRALVEPRTRSSATCAAPASSSASSWCATARRWSRRRDEASYVVNRMRDAGILLGTDGPYHNVLKIRPPMPFTIEDADLLASSLDLTLRQVER